MKNEYSKASFIRQRLGSSNKGGGHLVLSVLLAALCLPVGAQERTYTLDADFDEGTLVNVNHDSPNNDQLQLDSQATPFSFIWVAVSSEGTIVKIDTSSGAVLGEYRTHPTLIGFAANPSRTTVDNDGSVWVANRSSLPGSVTHVGLEENNQCEDRNNNGVIDTSTGLGDVRAWTTAAGPHPRGVGDAADECIVHHTNLPSNPNGGARHISVDANNDVWVSSTGNRAFDLLIGGKYDVANSGTVLRSEPSVGFGGYGGLIDGNGVIWSAQPLLRWDTANFLTGANGDPVPGGPNSIGPPLAGTNWSGQGGDSYGLCINPNNGEVWNTQLSGNLINRYAPDGTWLSAHQHGSTVAPVQSNAQGCVVDSNGHVWVAHSILGGGNTVGHLDAAGNWLGDIPVGSGPTGVAVDANGKVWATNYNSQTVSRIDPTLGAFGAVDLTTVDIGGKLYNYSDMTGSTLIAPPNSGTWSVDYDSGTAGVEWGFVTWTSDEPGDSAISVEVASSTDGITYSAFEPVTQNVDLTVPHGQFIRVKVSFTRASTNESPILFDLTITANHPPECTSAVADPGEIWPPNHKFVPVGILGITDPDGDPVTLTIDSIFQDEPVDTLGDGSFTPDGLGVGSGVAEVRAERIGTVPVPGNGRVYHIGFTADDGQGESCNGVVTVGVPHDKASIPIDDGALYDSTVP